MDSISFDGPAADLGCGDGTLSYIMAGGKIGNFDLYGETNSLGKFNKGADIYNRIAGQGKALDADGSGLRYKFTYGIDHKEGLISKAKRFGGLYENTLVHDLNKKIPLAGGRFILAFSNVLYWLEDVKDVLADWNRILAPKGKLILFVPNSNFKEKAWFYYRAPHKGGRKYYNYFDRGYGSLIKHCYKSGEWERMFKKNGFRVVNHVKYLTDPVMEIWNIGTRPISPLLINMANNIVPEKRRRIKEEWVNYFYRFMAPIVHDEFNKKPKEGHYAFHFYVLEKVQ